MHSMSISTEQTREQRPPVYSGFRPFFVLECRRSLHMADVTHRSRLSRVLFSPPL